MATQATRGQAVYRLPQQVSEKQARILRPTVGEVLFDEFIESLSVRPPPEPESDRRPR